MNGGHGRDRQLRNWARALVSANRDCSPLGLTEAVADRVQSQGSEHQVDLDEDPPGGWSNPWLLGIVHEQAVSPERRTARGAWYTPRSVVDGLVNLAMPADGSTPEFIADPTCGGGAFLLSALDHLVARGIDPAVAVTRVGGQDIDADAAAVAKMTVAVWAAAHGVTMAAEDADITVGDALAGYPEHWPAVELLVGNPPFASPLRAGAVPASASDFRREREEHLGPYADLAAIHLLAAIERCDGGTVALVQPQSVLAGRDTAGLRLHCSLAAPLSALWAAREAVFDAGVRACGVVLRPGTEPGGAVALASGPDVERRGIDQSAGTSWSGLAAAALGAPGLPASMPADDGDNDRDGHRDGGEDRLGSLVAATAGFRDEYYGLVAACREQQTGVGPPSNRLVTVGAVEPLATRWGRQRSKFGGKWWDRPHIMLSELDDKVLAWTKRQLRPKVVLATQSRILEPVVDRSGRLIPATPLVAVHADEADLTRVAAVLLAPPVVVWAWRQWFGTALAVDALKLAARQVADLPLPGDHNAWDEAAALVAAGEHEDEGPDEAWQRSCAVAKIMNRAYGADESVYRWWLERSRRPQPPEPAAVGVGHPR